MPDTTRETILATFLTECAAAFTKAAEARERLLQQEASSQAEQLASLAPAAAPAGDCGDAPVPAHGHSIQAMPHDHSIREATPADLAAVRFP